MKQIGVGLANQPLSRVALNGKVTWLNPIHVIYGGKVFMRSTIQNKKGFSLIELMVVVAIIGILAAIAVPNFQRFQRKARQAEARGLLGGLYTSMEAFRAEWEEYTGDLADIGFAPSGTLNYGVGFTGIGNAPPSPPFNSGGIGIFETVAACNSGNAIFAGCNNSGRAVAPGVGGAPAQATFTAGAEADIGGAANDQWTMDNLKAFTNVTDGTF